tara:strand:+ start:303 stop:446 length:144 start_codon:yes stop_codon:yes gene_type:complete
MEVGSLNSFFLKKVSRSRKNIRYERLKPAAINQSLKVEAGKIDLMGA